MSYHLTPDPSSCGSKVAKSCHRDYGLLVGCGTTALALACMMTPPTQKKIIIPAIACPQVLYAVLYANCEPVFVDICSNSGLIDPNLVRDVLEQDPMIGAVLVAHTFGHVADLCKITSHARTRGTLVIEDVAQAQGGEYADGRPLGAIGDISIVSFGHTKILDVGGGGVLMTDRHDIYDACVLLAEQLQPSPINLEARFAEYRSQYYSEWNSRVDDPAALNRIGRLHHHFRDIFLYREDGATPKRIIASLPMLPMEVSARRELATEYTTLLKDAATIRLCEIASGSVPWRFVFRVPAHERNKLVGLLRNAGVDVSCWYPCLANFFRDDSEREILPNADAFANEVVNLWVTPGYERQQIHLACTIIREYFG
jgi:dTDP-4-amino-4,6-dideoxygalactose transaminase